MRDEGVRDDGVRDDGAEGYSPREVLTVTVSP